MFVAQLFSLTGDSCHGAGQESEAGLPSSLPARQLLTKDFRNRVHFYLGALNYFKMPRASPAFCLLAFSSHSHILSTWSPA